MNYTDQWRQAVLPTWQASFDHPFITALHDGTLPEDTFATTSSKITTTSPPLPPSTRPSLNTYRLHKPRSC